MRELKEETPLQQQQKKQKQECHHPIINLHTRNSIQQVVQLLSFLYYILQFLQSYSEESTKNLQNIFGLILSHLTLQPHD